MNAQTLERCFTDTKDREMGNIVGTVEDRIQNATLTAVDDIFRPKIELVVRMKAASTEQDTFSITANLERGQNLGITAFFQYIFHKNNTFHELIVNDETQGKCLTK